VKTGPAVFDASLVVRAVVPETAAARVWLEQAVRRELTVHVPDLLYAEVAQALADYVRAGERTRADAIARMDFVLRLPFDVHQSQRIAGAALAVSLGRGITAYDACYAVVAELWDAVLVTADRRLAAAVPRSELVV
jgi:predicted nucleic acid-binding protein